ncbi:MAG: phosphate-starvation-inducible PsiE family protein, partial [Planctomycetota bacterium]
MTEDQQHGRFMMLIVDKFEHVITTVLLFTMMLAVFVATADVGLRLVRMLHTSPFLLLEVTEVSEVFGFVFMVLIGLELLETVKTYLSSEQLHVEVVFLVAMIAIARKVILLDVKHLDP